MTTITDPKTRSLLPRFMRSDQTSTALADAFDSVLSHLNSKKLRTWDAIDELNEEECDALAIELRVLWYNATGTVQQKRDQIKKSDEIWQHLGTKYAVELALSQIFGQAQVVEFWKYPEGLPHHFKISIERPGTLSDENVRQCIQCLEIVKRTSQILDGIELTVRNEFDGYAGMIVNDAAIEHVKIS